MGHAFEEETPKSPVLSNCIDTQSIGSPPNTMVTHVVTQSNSIVSSDSVHRRPRLHDVKDSQSDMITQISKNDNNIVDTDYDGPPIAHLDEQEDWYTIEEPIVTQDNNMNNIQQQQLSNKDGNKVDYPHQQHLVSSNNDEQDDNHSVSNHTHTNSCDHSGDFECDIHSVQSLDEDQNNSCSNCVFYMDENEYLQRRVARLEVRLEKANEFSQTHGQRVLKSAFHQKIKLISAEHAQKTTEMLNLQKKCCEEELEAMENENQATVTALQMELRAEKVTRERLLKQFETERDATLEKTQTTMQAVQKKLSQMRVRCSHLEEERNYLDQANAQKQIMIEILASTAAAKDVERKRLDLLSKTQEEERERKNKLIEVLQNEVMDLRRRIDEESTLNTSLLTSIEKLQLDHDKEIEKHVEDLADCKKESKQETERLGRLFTSVMQDFANVQSDVSTND